MPFNSSNSTFTGPAFSRRALLRTTVAVGGLALFGNLAKPLPASAADGDVSAFTQLSAFLTGYDLDPVLGGRYLAALRQRDSDFDQKSKDLAGLINKSGVSDMDALLALPAKDPAIVETATKIVSAWYLGVVGEPEDAELITYADALMYRPTKGILSIPTYGPGPNAWGDKPGSSI